ncbi:hypothetical protein TcWFU_010319 [Taenia crassiceps]|uniref:Uncharacterized protein n=1 Tax=Taenia crassiceps TaxID=6207 RepID=A0ABR4Q2C1_9CEST
MRQQILLGLETLVEGGKQNVFVGCVGNDAIEIPLGVLKKLVSPDGGRASDANQTSFAGFLVVSNLQVEGGGRIASGYLLPPQQVPTASSSRRWDSVLDDLQLAASGGEVKERVVDHEGAKAQIWKRTSEQIGKISRRCLGLVSPWCGVLIASAEGKQFFPLVAPLPEDALECGTHFVAESHRQGGYFGVYYKQHERCYCPL